MKRTVCFSILIAILASCTKDIAVKTGEGEGYMSLNVDIPSATKAAMDADELLNTASVKIYKADFSGLVRSYKYSEMPEHLWLPVDEYRVDVLAGEAAKENPAPASWEQKSYKGSRTFTINAGLNTPVQVEASVCNAVTRISFAPSVAENFAAGYTFTVSIDGVENSSLTYDESKSGAEGYFNVNGLEEPSLLWTFSGNLSKDGSEFTKSGVIPAVKGGKAYTMNVNYTIKDGDVSLSLMVDYTTEVIDDVVVFEPASTGISSSAAYEIWAGHATVHADVDEVEYNDPSAIKFMYRAEGSEEWQTVDAERESEGTYKAVLTGLDPATTYEYKLNIAGEDLSDAKFTTAQAKTLPNGSFDEISKVSGESFYKWWNPDSEIPECRTEFWASGNGDEKQGGSAGMGYVITEPSDDKMDGDRSVLCLSKWAVVKFAAGNIFTGSWNGTTSDLKGGKVMFGRPWTARPTALRVWAKYSADVINHVDKVPSGVTVNKGVDYDMGSIKVALGTWDYRTYGGTRESPIFVNTKELSTFVDFNTDASTIANGELVLYGDGYQSINGGEKQAASVGEWRQITIPIDYRNLTTMPTHIVISCASSIYGDYFTGCDSARLYLDGFELLYE